jgi:hypothetical protein
MDRLAPDHYGDELDALMDALLDAQLYSCAPVPPMPSLEEMQQKMNQVLAGSSLSFSSAPRASLKTVEELCHEQVNTLVQWYGPSVLKEIKFLSVNLSEFVAEFGHHPHVKMFHGGTVITVNPSANTHGQCVDVNFTPKWRARMATYQPADLVTACTAHSWVDTGTRLTFCRHCNIDGNYEGDGTISAKRS